MAFASNASIDFSYASPEQSTWTQFFIRMVERFTGQGTLKNLYMSYQPQETAPGGFFQDAVNLLDLQLDLDDRSGGLSDIEGPVIFIANHPYGVLDGLVFSLLTNQRRPGTKIMANTVLCRAPETRDSLLPVDFSNTREALNCNLETRKQALKTLLDGGSIGLFPGGGVAATQKIFSGPALDPQWSPFLGKLVLASKATVVPVYFAGQNSRLFQIASHTNYNLRLALFFHETRRQMGQRVKIAIGEPIGQDELSALKNRDEIVAHLRRKTYALSERLGEPMEQAAEQHYTYPKRFGLTG